MTLDRFIRRLEKAAMESYHSGKTINPKILLQTIDDDGNIKITQDIEIVLDIVDGTIELQAKE